MKFFVDALAWASALRIAFSAFASAQDANITLVPTSLSFEGDNTAFFYSRNSLLLTNDGGASTGGFRIFSVSPSPPTEKSHFKTGRSKFVVPVYDVGGKDIFVTIAAPDSILRVFDAGSLKEIAGARKKVLGDWSTVCIWRSEKSGSSYLYLFGKKMVVQFLVTTQKKDLKIVEIQTFAIPIEGETCAISSRGVVYFSAEDRALYSFQAREEVKAPEIKTVSEGMEVAGLATYTSEGDYLFVAHDEVVDVYDEKLTLKGSIALNGVADLSIEGGLSILQSSATGYSSGALALAFEGEDGSGAAIGSLDGVLAPLGIKPNTKFSPRDSPCKQCDTPICDRCSGNGFCASRNTCQCFAGFAGHDCGKIVCKNECSRNGQCVGPNTCKCRDSFAGPDCSFKIAKAKFETDANGGDGDDPAIWIHPKTPAQSRIVTTTKSEEGAGFAVFDLEGTLLQHQPAEEPNNVDVIYGFKAGERAVDLTFAACRGDNTLCLFELSSTGLILPISGGIQSTLPDYEVYGSCAYHSAQTGNFYLFVNSKEALYLQYELTSSTNGTLQTTLVRQFTGGSGGQVEGCVADDAAGYLFLGEEPEGIWRYEAEPTGSSTGLQIAKVGDGQLSADVEGITLVTAKTGKDGYILVSSQGISAYLVYERAPPHKYVMTFTVVDNKELGVDHVSNTDGIAAVGSRLNGNFPGGLFVTHDDANELVGGGTANEASFKLVSLEDILGKERTRKLGW
ncbi:thermostable phytase [Amniculicola lignicola CBS 123094]|uniref:Thermostable phytase n=1 Tax=Amniculicola lignicola CBS 123094 TaxID=1392246 RepID=A0A6A5VWJ1_9PLEO|nr:thermostable phytase [Amniculicola lignicola CBS 123094]